MLDQKFKSIASLAKDSGLFQKSTLEETKNKIDKSLNDEGFHYEIPVLLCLPYSTCQISNKQFVIAYHHKFEFKMSESALSLGVLTSTPLKPSDRIQYSYFTQDGKQVIHETVTVQTSETTTVMELDDFQLLVKFNQLIQAEWYKIAVKNIEKHEKKIDEYFYEDIFNFDKMKRTYLFTINLNGEIDWNRIEAFVAERNGSILPRTMSQDYAEMGRLELEDFNSYIQTVIFTSLTHKTCYNVYHVLDNIWETKLSAYFEILLTFASEEWTLLKIAKYYGYSEEEYREIENESIGKFFFEMPQKARIETIYHLRNSYEKAKGTDEEFKTNQPIVLALYTKHIKSLQMFRTEQFKLIVNQDVQKTFESSIRNIVNLKKPQVIDRT